MSAIKLPYEQIVRYLKGILSNRERHDLEKEMMRDPFDEEAFEGLSQLTADNLEADSSALMNKLNNRLQPRKTRNLIAYYKIAASLVLLTGIGVALYLVFRTPSRELITQDVLHEKQAPPPETVQPYVPSLSGKKSTEPSREEKEKDPVMQEDKSPQEQAENRFEVVVEAESIGLLAVEEANADVISAPRVISEQKTAAAAPQMARLEDSKATMITGRVLDNSGEALPGVNVMEKGTARGTITDQYGNFNLQVSNPDTKLTFSTIGFKPLEIKSMDILGKDITLTEDLMALNEVVVVNRRSAARAKSSMEDDNLNDSDMRVTDQLQGRVAGVDVEKASGKDKSAEVYSLVKPIPPGGSLKEFRKWVDNRVDHSLFQTFPGKHRIQANLTVHANGTVSNISIRNNVPAAIADEYMRVIAISPLWKPALENGSAIEVEIALRIVLEVE